MTNPVSTEQTDPIGEVRRAKARYCRFIDTRQWDDFAALLLPDVGIRMLDPDGGLIAAFDDRDAFMAVTTAFLQGARSSHHIHNEEIDLISDSEISAIWAMEDIVVNAAPAPGQPARMHGYGHYHETWKPTPQGWRIARLELKRTILEFNDNQETQP